MINYESLFKLSYGLYIVCSGDEKEGNGYISNTVFQITAEPPTFAASCNKNNFSADIIMKHHAFSVSVLSNATSAETIGQWGYKSGKDYDKMKGAEVHYGETGVPIILDSCIAFFEFKLKQTFDMGTHWLFVGELLHAEMIDDDADPLTYQYYREVKKGFASVNAPTYIDKSKLDKKRQDRGKVSYKCTICGYVYGDNEEEIGFSELPDDWKCPVCGADKEDFIEI